MAKVPPNKRSQGGFWGFSCSRPQTLVFVFVIDAFFGAVDVSTTEDFISFLGVKRSKRAVLKSVTVQQINIRSFTQSLPLPATHESSFGMPSQRSWMRDPRCQGEKEWFFFGDLKGDLHSDSERSERSAERASHPDATDPGGWTELVGSSGDPGGTEKGGKRNVWARTRPVRARTEEPGVFKVLGEQKIESRVESAESAAEDGTAPSTASKERISPSPHRSKHPVKPDLLPPY